MGGGERGACRGAASRRRLPEIAPEIVRDQVLVVVRSRMMLSLGLLAGEASHSYALTSPDE